jgi:biopolymer transport protein TolR
MQTGGGNGGGGNGGGKALGGYTPLRSRHSGSALGEINVTPLVDVVLVLLLVFMITAPMMTPTIDVTLPTANIPKVNPDLNITVSIRADGRVFLMDKQVVLPRLVDELRSTMESRSNKTVTLKADESLRYGKVIEVVETLKQGGVEVVGMAYTLPETARP